MIGLSSSRLPAAPRSAAGAMKYLSQIFGVWRSRAALARLDDRLLDDIGVSRATARVEARRFL